MSTSRSGPSAPPHSVASDSAAIQARQHLMRLCAEASAAELRAALDAVAPLPAFADIRAPENALAMVRGRIGGDGAPFNLGEATVTRAAVRLESGETGFSYLLGRDAERARHAALIDALGQRPDIRPVLEDAFVRPVSARLDNERTRQREETAATRVNFFTLVRGDN